MTAPATTTRPDDVQATGSLMPSAVPGHLPMVRRVPVGVVGAITPWMIGMVHNDGTLNDEAIIPFGGRGLSGNGGRFGGAADFDEFTEWQWVTMRDEATSFPV